MTRQVARRTIIAGAVATGVGVAGLAGCSADAANGTASGDTTTAGDTATAGPTQDATSQPTTGATGGLTGTADVLAATSDIPVGGGKIFTAEQVVVTQPTTGDFKAFGVLCPHQGCAVSSISGGQIICPCHNSRFSIADGSVQTGPATRALSSVNIQVQGENLVLG